MIWQAGPYRFTFPRPALVMGVVNVTPDSFSDGGRFLETGPAVEQALKLVEEGADLLDIGGESTRPGAEPVPADEELRRVLPVIQALRGQVRTPLSVDTTKAEVARVCLAEGASVINDIGASHAEPGLWRSVAEAGAGYVLMHMQGRPATMHLNPVYENVVEEVNQFLGQQLQNALAAGLAAEQIVLDVGLGFGKTATHNLQLLASWQTFRLYRRPLLLGASRKSFIGQIAGEPNPAQRLAGSLACACWAVREGVEVIRTHDVAATKQAVAMTEALVQQSQHGVLADHNRRP